MPCFLDWQRSMPDHIEGLQSMQEIEDMVRTEFGVYAKHLLPMRVVDLSDMLNKEVKDACCKPGVYVFWVENGWDEKESRVEKVGRSFSNSHKRAQQHIKDNTKGLMRDRSSMYKLLLFNAQDDHSKHWIAALEVFLELNLNPNIKSKRIG